MKKSKTNTYSQVCCDCKRNVPVVYAKSIGNKKVAYVCWACFNTEEE